MSIKDEMKRLVTDSKKDRLQKEEIESKKAERLDKKPIQLGPSKLERFTFNEDPNLIPEIQINEEKQIASKAHDLYYDEIVAQYRKSQDQKQQETPKRGRPKKSSTARFKRIYLSMKYETFEVFSKINSGTRMNGSSSKVAYLIEEYLVWKKVKDKYKFIMERELSIIESSIREDNKAPISKINNLVDYASIVGLSKKEALGILDSKHHELFNLILNIHSNYKDRVHSGIKQRDI